MVEIEHIVIEPMIEDTYMVHTTLQNGEIIYMDYETRKNLHGNLSEIWTAMSTTESTKDMYTNRIYNLMSVLNGKTNNSEKIRLMGIYPTFWELLGQSLPSDFYFTYEGKLYRTMINSVYLDGNLFERDFSGILEEIKS